MTDVADAPTDRFDRTLARTVYVGKAQQRDTGDDTLTAKNAAADIGSSGLKQTSGIVIEEFDRNLRGTKANKVYEEMGASPIAGGVLFLMTEWMTGATWTVSPFDPDNPDSVADAEFVEQCMGDMSHSWSAMVAEAATMVQFGWSWAHMVYKPRNGQQPLPGDSSKYTDGRWGWRKFSFKGQDSLTKWEFDEDGGVKGWWQQTQDKGKVFLPIGRGLLFRTTTRKGNPQGYSMLRRAYEPWWQKKRLQEIEGIGHERNLAGMPVCYIDVEAYTNDTTKAEYEKLVKDVRVDEQMGVVLPMVYATDDDGKVSGHPLYKFELLASPGQGRSDIGNTIARYAREMAMSVLADVILMGHEQGGIGSSQGVAVTKDEMLRRSMMGLLGSMADVINRHEIPRLMRLNGRVTGELPFFEVAPPESTTAEQIVKMLVDLASTGMAMWPSAELAQYVQAHTGIPVADMAEEDDDAEREDTREVDDKPEPEPEFDPDIDPELADDANND